MRDGKRKILVCVEGEKLDVRLMEKLFALYEIDVRYEIVPFKTNIYALYRSMFAQGDPERMDLLQVLKERESDEEKRRLLDEKYSDILLVFDMDPQDSQFSSEKLSHMADYFCDSTDAGQLYINYPMVEAFYHMASIPDPEFMGRCATWEELQDKGYKARVNRENRNHDYTKFVVSRAECDIVIGQNIKKAWGLLGGERSALVPHQADLLSCQLAMLREKGAVAVLSTCPFFIADYSSALLAPPLGG